MKIKDLLLNRIHGNHKFWQYFPSLTTRLICQHDSEYGWKIKHNELQLGKSQLWHELPSEKTQDAMKVIRKFLRSISK